MDSANEGYPPKDSLRHMATGAYSYSVISQTISFLIVGIGSKALGACLTTMRLASVPTFAPSTNAMDADEAVNDNTKGKCGFKCRAGADSFPRTLSRCGLCRLAV